MNITQTLAVLEAQVAEERRDLAQVRAQNIELLAALQACERELAMMIENDEKCGRYGIKTLPFGQPSGLLAQVRGAIATATPVSNVKGAWRDMVKA